MSCRDCISTIAHGIAGNVKAIVGIDRPPDDVIRARRRLCLDCEHAEPLIDAGVIVVGRKTRCGLCSCVIKSKTAVASETCPVGKW